MRTFGDTNIVVYANSRDPKAAEARVALKQVQVISVQVLNEFANVARRRLQSSIAEITAISRDLREAFEIKPVTIGMHDAALDICDRYGFGFYDSLILATALDADCTRLYSEDLQHNQLIDNRLRIVNPFR